MEDCELIDLPRKFLNEKETRALCDAISRVEMEDRKAQRLFAMGIEIPTQQIRKDTAARFEMVKLIDQMAEKAGRWDYILNLMPELEDKLNG
jgi:hypothetical protein